MTDTAKQTKVAAALRRLSRERRTGVFQTVVSEVSRAIMFERGGIVGARSSLLDERLGEVMVRRGRITQQQLDDASVLVRSRGTRLGDVLIELRIADEDEVNAFVRAQLTEIASMLLREPAPKLEFRRDASFHRVVNDPIPVADAILEASRHPTENDENAPAVVDYDLRPRLTPEATELLQTLRLESHEAFVLSRCDGLSRVSEIIAQIPLPEEKTARILTALELAAIIEMPPKTRPH